MTANHSPDAAVDDADLIRWLDGELDDDERARVDDAVARDPALAARLEQLRGRAARLSALLQGTDPDLAVVAGVSHAPVAKVIELNAAWAARQGMPARTVPPPQPVPGWLQAAAIIALLLSASLLVPPVRAWIVGLLRPADGPGTFTPIVATPAAALPIDTLGIRFESAATTFTIEFATAPAAGTLSVEWQDVDSVLAERYSAGGGEELMRIDEGLLRIRNAAASTADYRVVLPGRVAAVTVRVPGRPDATWQFTTGAARSRTLELGPRTS